MVHLSRQTGRRDSVIPVLHLAVEHCPGTEVSHSVSGLWKWSE